MEIISKHVHKKARIDLDILAALVSSANTNGGMRLIEDCVTHPERRAYLDSNREVLLTLWNAEQHLPTRFIPPSFSEYESAIKEVYNVCEIAEHDFFVVNTADYVLTFKWLESFRHLESKEFTYMVISKLGHLWDGNRDAYSKDFLGANVLLCAVFRTKEEAEKRRVELIMNENLRARELFVAKKLEPKRFIEMFYEVLDKPERSGFVILYKEKLNIILRKFQDENKGKIQYLLYSDFKTLIIQMCNEICEEIKNYDIKKHIGVTAEMMYNRLVLY